MIVASDKILYKATLCEFQNRSESMCFSTAIISCMLDQSSSVIDHRFIWDVVQDVDGGEACTETGRTTDNDNDGHR